MYGMQCRNYGHRGSDLDASQYHNHLPAPLMDLSRLPKHFSWCSNGADNLCTPSWNQHIPIYCGSCWAHGSTHMVQDRLKIAKKGMGPDVMLSRQALLNCGAYHGFGDGCNGGDVFDMFGYMTEYGLPDESCMIYTASDHHVFPDGLKQCPDTAFCRNCNSVNESDPGTCWAVKPPVTYKLKHWGRIEPSNVHGELSAFPGSAPSHASYPCMTWSMFSHSDVHAHKASMHWLCKSSQARHGNAVTLLLFPCCFSDLPHAATGQQHLNDTAESLPLGKKRVMHAGIECFQLPSYSGTSQLMSNLYAHLYAHHTEWLPS